MNILTTFLVFILLNTLRYILMPFLVFMGFIYIITLLGIIVEHYFLTAFDHDYVWAIGFWGGISAIIGYFYLVGNHNFFKCLYTYKDADLKLIALTVSQYIILPTIVYLIFYIFIQMSSAMMHFIFDYDVSHNIKQLILLYSAVVIPSIYFLYISITYKYKENKK